MKYYQMLTRDKSMEFLTEIGTTLQERSEYL